MHKSECLDIACHEIRGVSTALASSQQVIEEMPHGKSGIGWQRALFTGSLDQQWSI